MVVPSMDGEGSELLKHFQCMAGSALIEASLIRLSSGSGSLEQVDRIDQMTNCQIWIDFGNDTFILLVY